MALTQQEIKDVATAVTQAIKPELNALAKRLDAMEASPLFASDEEEEQAAEDATKLEEEAAQAESDAADKRIAAAKAKANKPLAAMTDEEKEEVAEAESEIEDLEAKAAAKRLRAARIRKALATGIAPKLLAAMGELVTDSVGPIAKILTDHVSRSGGALATDRQGTTVAGTAPAAPAPSTPAPERKSLSAGALQLLSKHGIDASQATDEAALDAAMRAARIPTEKQFEIKLRLNGA